MLMFFCNPAWPQHKLEGGEIWPENGSLNYNIVLQLDLFSKRQGKWTEIPYNQVFMALYQTLTHILLRGPRTPLSSPSTFNPPTIQLSWALLVLLICHHTCVLSSSLCAPPPLCLCCKQVAAKIVYMSPSVFPGPSPLCLLSPLCIRSEICLKRTG